MNCFVCSEYLNGDDQFIQSHLNRCQYLSPSFSFSYSALYSFVATSEIFIFGLGVQVSIDKVLLVRIFAPPHHHSQLVTLKMKHQLSLQLDKINNNLKKQQQAEGILLVSKISMKSCALVVKYFGTIQVSLLYLSILLLLLLLCLQRTGKKQKKRERNMSLNVWSRGGLRISTR